MKRPINPESAPVRVYDEKGTVVVCVKRYPSFTLSYHQLRQVQYLLNLEPGILDTAQFLLRELGSEAAEMFEIASEKSGLPPG